MIFFFAVTPSLLESVNVKIKIDFQDFIIILPYLLLSRYYRVMKSQSRPASVVSTVKAYIFY